ncbi:MAG: aminotransferase class IV [Puniceicoccales bacterium]
MEPSAVRIAPDDHGLLYGEGGFETFRTFGGKCFLLDKHRERLMRTLAPLRIEKIDTLMFAESGSLQSAVKELLAAEGLDDAVFRYTVSAGAGGFGLPRAAYDEPWDMLSVRRLPAPPPEGGVPLRVLETRRDSGEQQVRGKSLAYLNSLLGWRELQGSGTEPGGQGLMLNVRGEVCEAVTSNIFWVKDGVLFTPSVETGLLPGVHRAHLLELAPQVGIEAREGRWPLQTLCEADAIGLINAAIGPVAVSSLSDESGQVPWRRNAIEPDAFSRMVNAYRASLPT